MKDLIQQATAFAESGGYFEGAEVRLWVGKLTDAMERLTAGDVALPEPFSDWPQYHAQGMGCGLEDRDITDRYEAAEYGWQQCEERMLEQGPFYYDAQLIDYGNRRAAAAVLAERNQVQIGRAHV